METCCSRPTFRLVSGLRDSDIVVCPLRVSGVTDTRIHFVPVRTVSTFVVKVPLVRVEVEGERESQLTHIWYVSPLDESIKCVILCLCLSSEG